MFPHRKDEGTANWRKGFTLVEVLTVITILAILGALLFPVFRGAKDSAKHTVTISRLSQMYKAMLIYGSDYDTYDDAPGLGSVPGMPLENVGVLAPYGIKGDMPHSAAFPDAGKKRWPTSFTYYWVTELHVPPGTPSIAHGEVEKNRQRLLDEQGSFVIVEDIVHDYFEFWPSEKSSDPYMQRRFEINLRVNGSVKAERRPGIRGSILPF